jgi:hypothetical protein
MASITHACDESLSGADGTSSGIVWVSKHCGDGGDEECLSICREVDPMIQLWWEVSKVFFVAKNVIGIEECVTTKRHYVSTLNTRS